MSFKFPSFSQWKQIFKVLKKKEKITLLVFFLLAVASLLFLVSNFYINNTKTVPAIGGTYVEAIVGQPRFINPIYGETNDIDRTIIDLTFSGLMKYDREGKITKDLAEDYNISSDGKTYEFKLKDNVIWHDGKSLTVDDIIFTIKTIQNSDYKSPLRANWIDVDIEKISNNSIRFKLKSPYNSFLENCTVKIIPKHIWESILPENFALSYYNLQPIGSGPFQFSKIEQTNTGFIKVIKLKSNHKYYNGSAFISNIHFQFFEKKEDLVMAANTGRINGFTLASLDNDQILAEKEINQDWRNYEKFYVYYFSLPRYFAVFFNLSPAGQKSPIFSDSNVRKSLIYSVNKEELIKKMGSEMTSNNANENNILAVDSPILPEFFNYQSSPNIYNFDIDKAKSLLDKAGFKDNGFGQREKAIAKKPAFQFTSYLKSGSKGIQVIQLQECLAKLPNDNFAEILKNETNGTYGKATEDAVTEFQKKYLPDKNPTGEVGMATRAELNKLCTKSQQNSQLLKFTLVTVDQPHLLKVANLLGDYWKNVGVLIDIKAVSVTDLKPIIKDRSYDALLYGEALGAEPDLYPFWHSSQKVYPGLNLSSYENKNVDQLLKDSREALDNNTKAQKLEKLQDIIISDAPALFLYNPDYIYWVSKKVHGIDTEKIIDPAKRFVNATSWYIKTKRIWK